MSTGEHEAGEQRGQDAVRRHTRTKVFYDQAVAEGDPDRLAGLCAGKHGRWRQI
ncbi:hypothetical protein ACF08W_31745 [Streptomyces sp. NPDC015144]|uniref:hypothetical protein n=1 Tax=Streptomyces sp. NPDC015144 TaxID=3364944 RepID=UPI0037015D3B